VREGIDDPYGPEFLNVIEVFREQGPAICALRGSNDQCVPVRELVQRSNLKGLPDESFVNRLHPQSINRSTSDFALAVGFRD
jgi:hypothetical protein